MFWSILGILLLMLGIYMFGCMGIAVALNARNKRYQKLWDEEKATRIRLNPRISRAELREYYVMFLKRNHCNVVF